MAVAEGGDVVGVNPITAEDEEEEGEEAAVEEAEEEEVVAAVMTGTTPKPALSSFIPTCLLWMRDPKRKTLKFAWSMCLSTPKSRMLPCDALPCASP